MKIGLNVSSQAAKHATRARKPSTAGIGKTGPAGKAARKTAIRAAKTNAKVNKIISRSNAKSIRRTKRALNKGYNPTKHAITTAGAVGSGLVVSSAQPDTKYETPIYIVDGELPWKE